MNKKINNYVDDFARNESYYMENIPKKYDSKCDQSFKKGHMQGFLNGKEIGQKISKRYSAMLKKAINKEEEFEVFYQHSRAIILATGYDFQDVKIDSGDEKEEVLFGYYEGRKEALMTYSKIKKVD